LIYVIFSDRLGNNLFQISAGLSAGEEVTICALSNAVFEQTMAFKDIFFRDISVIDFIPSGIQVYEEPYFHFNKIPFKKGQDIAIKGYFQSYKYFDNDLICERLSPPESVDVFLQDHYPELLTGEFTSIHVRRGDYLKALYKHPVCSKRYYQNAIKSIGENERFVVISDDIDWCKKNISSKNITFIENSNSVIDFFIPTFCKNNIISNSSYGWWGAYLNKNSEKVVIAPDPWFGFRNSNNTEDLLPVSWIVIPVAQDLYSFCWSRLQFLIHHIKYRLKF
jgi:hypothetical protein